MKKIFASKEMMRISGTKVLDIDGVDSLQFRMEQMGWKQKDLVPYIGSKSKVSEVLNRKRPLTIAMMRNLYFGLGIPAHTLLQYPSEQQKEK